MVRSPPRLRVESESEGEGEGEGEGEMMTKIADARWTFVVLALTVVTIFLSTGWATFSLLTSVPSAARCVPVPVDSAVAPVLGGSLALGAATLGRFLAQRVSAWHRLYAVTATASACAALLPLFPLLFVISLPNASGVVACYSPGAQLAMKALVLTPVASVTLMTWIRWPELGRTRSWWPFCLTALLIVVMWSLTVLWPGLRLG